MSFRPFDKLRVNSGGNLLAIVILEAKPIGSTNILDERPLRW